MLKKIGCKLTPLLLIGVSLAIGNADIATDLVPNSGIKVPQSILSNPAHMSLINYTVEWTITLNHLFALGLTPVFDTLLWVSSGGRTSSSDSNWILIYDLRTRTLVDSFQQATSTTWGYRDMCFYNGYVYAGTEGTLHKIDPNTHAVVGSYSVSGISGGIIRALTDNDVEDSLFTANSASPIYKFANTGGAVRQVAANTYDIYGLAYDEHGFVWGSSQTTGADLVKYSYPGFTVLDSCVIPELQGGIAGGCEMWNNMFLLYLGQCVPNDIVLCLRLYTVSHDVGVRSIVSPTGRIPSSDWINVEAVIKNFGSNEETFPAYAFIMTQTDDTVFTAETSLTIPAQTEQSVMFGEFITDPNMVYDVLFYTYLQGDENPTNDTMTGEARTTPDAGVSRIISPTGQIIPGTTVDAEAMVINFSADPKIVPANLTIVDTVTGSTILDKDTSLILFAAESLAVVFGQFTSVSGSFYYVVAYTFLHGDDDPSNDTAYATATCVGIGEDTRNDVLTATILHTAKPNPVLKGTAQISFSLAKKGDVSISIFDVTGRMVRNLANSPYEAGSYTLTWDGKNVKGNEVMSGIYFYTIETSNYKSTRKLVFMR